MYATEMYAQDTKNYVKNVHNSNICFNPQLDINHMSVNSKWTNKFYVYIETSLVGQTVKRLPTMRETWVRSLGSIPGFDPWVGKILWRRKWQPTPVLLPGKSHGWKSLVGYSHRILYKNSYL